MRQYSGHFYGPLNHCLPGPDRQRIKKKMLPIVRYCQLSMSAVFLIAVDTLSNTTESEKTNKLMDDPDQDVH